MKQLLNHENMLYTALWTLLFLVPVGMLLHETTHGDSFDWHELLHIWRQVAIYLGIFIFHNIVLAPMLMERRRRWLYFTTVAVLVSLFFMMQCMQKPTEPEIPFHEDTKRPEPMGHRPQGPFDHDHDKPADFRPPRPLVGQRDVLSTIMLMLMLGMNIGVKLYFRRDEDQQRLTTLEHEHLEQQLEYLKYQINPHFLMNTLNNIHALVDIDPEQAKESIVELSKIMRFVLYEGSKQKVPLRQELSFLDNYLQLMRKRVTDKVRIDVNMPETIPDREIPPLILITFVENAFKHGITYQRPCFIEMSIDIRDDRLHFNCRNSKMPQGTVQQGGIGLSNIKRRLELIYGSDYTLQFDDQEETFEVNLDIPL